MAMIVSASEYDFIVDLFNSLGALPSKTGTASRIIQGLPTNKDYLFSAHTILTKMRQNGAIQFCSLTATYNHHPVSQQAISAYFTVVT